MAAKTVLVLIAALSTTASACLHARVLETRARPPADDLASAPDLEPDPRERLEPSISPAPFESEAYDTRLVEYASSDPSRPDDARVRALLRKPVATPRGLVIVLPVLGEDNDASDVFAIDLAERGYTTVRFYRKKRIFDPEAESAFHDVARTLRTSVRDVRRGVRWAVASGLGGSGGAGLLGISLGSFVGTLVAATDPAIQGSILALGGADLPGVIEHARSEDEIGEFLDALERRGWDAARIERSAKEALAPLDGARFAPRLDRGRTLMIHARFDAVVPYDHGTAIWEAAGRPHRLTLLSGHYSAAVFLPYLFRITAEHFERTLDKSRKSRSHAGHVEHHDRALVDPRPRGAASR